MDSEGVEEDVDGEKVCAWISQLGVDGQALFGVVVQRPLNQTGSNTTTRIKVVNLPTAALGDCHRVLIIPFATSSRPSLRRSYTYHVPFCPFFAVVTHSSAL